MKQTWFSDSGPAKSSIASFRSWVEETNRGCECNTSALLRSRPWAPRPSSHSLTPGVLDPLVMLSPPLVHTSWDVTCAAVLWALPHRPGLPRGHQAGCPHQQQHPSLGSSTAVESQQQGDGPGIPLSSTQPRQLLGRLHRSSLNFKEKSR